MKLVIVESPTKAKTLSKILKGDYQVTASYGHVRDLPKKELGVDIQKDFTPQYTVPSKALKQVKQLQKEVRRAELVILATDPDREGEAIAWHLAQVTGLEKGGALKKSCRRVVFHEITSEAVRSAFKAFRELDFPLVDSQQARRILDRLVGYKLSPLLWHKVGPGLSAGRVQSVAVRLIVDREREREVFKPEEYWTIDALLDKEGQPFKSSLQKIRGRQLKIKTEKVALALANDLRILPYKVSNVTRTERLRRPAPPFTTSTLQQVASNQLGFGARKTMQVAQRLFEAGLITYHRTDSLSLASAAVDAIRKRVEKDYGAQFLPENRVAYRTKSKLAQEAHEAIRPTKFDFRPSLKGDESELYDLIALRTLACQMNPATYDQVTADITAGQDYLFRASGSTLKFEGFLKAVGHAEDLENDKENALPNLDVGDSLNLQEILPLQHFTQPPPRYTEASLVKALEENGIGRPSTYAPIISTIQERGYVSKDGRYFFPEEVAKVVTDLLKDHFQEIVDIDFTARLEAGLDEIAVGLKDKVAVIRAFYEPFSKELKEADRNLKKKEVTTLEQTEEPCPECGEPLVVKLGRYGKFLSCSNFPKCKYARPLEGGGNESGESGLDLSQLGVCEQCGGQLILKEGRYGRFLACENYPRCKFTKTYLEKIGQACPKCQDGEIIVKRTRTGRTFYGCSNYPKCKFASWKKPETSQEKTAEGPNKEG